MVILFQKRSTSAQSVVRNTLVMETMRNQSMMDVAVMNVTAER